MTTEVDLAPAQYRINAVLGDALDVTFPIQTEAGDAADLTGYTAEADVVGAVTGTRTAFTATITSSSVRITLTTAQSASLDEIGRFDVRLTSGGATVTPIAGVLYARPPITTLD